MFYVVDKSGRIICNSADLEVARNLAHRIAEAGAWVAIATDDPNVVAQQSGWKVMDEQAGGRLGPSKAWALENDLPIETPIDKLESIVGKMNWDDGPLPPKPPNPPEPPPDPSPSDPPPTVER